MKILERLKEFEKSNNIAMISGEAHITYKELWEKSDILAGYIKEKYGDTHTPVIVWGHKNPMMLVVFLACVKSGRAYVPVDTSVPRNRVEAIIDSVQPDVIISTEEFMSYESYSAIQLATDSSIFERKYVITESDYIKEDDVYYIIFTSGSTGTPKGVQITYQSLNNFVEWALSLGSKGKQNKTFINQAPFSFDLSVMDLYMSLCSESCLFCLEKGIQTDYKKLFSALKESMTNVWVSTPSFEDLCLADDSFNQELLPKMELFLFCGETLTNKTVSNLLKRFPRAEIYNTYGPTESTVAVTEVCVDDAINEKYNPLPVGKSKSGTMIKIMNGDLELSDGEKGEVVIIGNTVSAGYFNNPEETQRRFFMYEKDGEKLAAYRTGDKGYIQDGQLFYCGRIDLQIKLHGYRMEIEDVEKNLMKVSKVKQAVVIPIWENEKVKYLKGVCVYDEPVESGFKIQKKIREEMSQFVPDYMIPRKIQFVNEIPMTANGKADRKRIQEME